MEFHVWEPVYERILADFGFGRAADERARDRLASLTEPFDLDALPAFEGRTVAVAGAAPTLADEAEAAAAADRVIAASAAATTLRDAGVGIDLAVTDLDGTPERLAAASHEGLPVAVHAHGDNVDALERWVPEFAEAQLLPTTQAAPTAHVRNFGGFTDGDRAAFLADALGAGELRFVGWQFDDPDVGELKAKKLRWAERLLYWLETRREERFGVLDGRRDGLRLPTDEK
ncbi:6-hydroxymethylpterin diphosphokinase MptE-like protein [Halolamina sp. C58]|uniref:6-hydroxymethylpterin diphosphokinase MptE-like protein n=1 Tax=Halolamina sp. C58 TaxID=3421640 RepID=UPI003EBAA1A7